jgi:hypothetical protein
MLGAPVTRVFVRFGGQLGGGTFGLRLGKGYFLGQGVKLELIIVLVLGHLRWEVKVLWSTSLSSGAPELESQGPGGLGEPDEDLTGGFGPPL